MGVYGDGVFVEPDGGDDVRRLLPDTGERFQLGKAPGHLSAELFDDVFGGGEDVRRLAAVQPAGKDVPFQLLLRKREHGARGVVLLEQLCRHYIDALVGALRRKDDRHQQFVGGGIVQRGARVRITFCQYLQCLCGLLCVHAAILP